MTHSAIKACWCGRPLDASISDPRTAAAGPPKLLYTADGLDDADAWAYLFAADPPRHDVQIGDHVVGYGRCRGGAPAGWAPDRLPRLTPADLWVLSEFASPTLWTHGLTDQHIAALDAAACAHEQAAAAPSPRQRAERLAAGCTLADVAAVLGYWPEGAVAP